MTNQEKEVLVKLIHSGKNSAADIKKELPNINLRSAVFSIALGDNLIYSEKSFYSEIEKIQYHFTDTDTFQLTETGKNVLHQIQKEERLLHISQISLNEAHQSGLYAKKAVFWAEISIAVSIGLFVLEKLLH